MNKFLRSLILWGNIIGLALTPMTSNPEQYRNSDLKIALVSGVVYTLLVIKEEW